MENKRKLNVSGFRGIWGDTLNADVVERYTQAFARFTKEDSGKENPSILIGRDGRESGPIIKKIIIEKLKNLGINAIDGDIMPTPTVLFSVRKHSYDGAIIITASHNPIEYNGLKFVNKNAFFTIKDEVEKIEKYYEENNFISQNTTDNTELVPNFTKEHADQILSHVDVAAIRNRKFKVVVDMINASACVMDPYLFEQLGVELIPLNNIPNGNFAHRPEPLRENLTEVMKITKEVKADVGFVHDPDADRLVIIDENGEVISEEYSIIFGIESILAKNPGKPITLNLSTSQMGTDVAQKYNSECYRSKVGEGYVVEKMIETKSIVGGEGNGGIIYPEVNFCRDSFTGLSLVLELLALRKQTISECIQNMPKYFIKKDKWPISGDLENMYSLLKEHFLNAKIDEQDGLRLDLTNGSWAHLRPSNTEPIIRLFGEAKTEKEISDLFNEIKLTLASK